MGDDIQGLAGVMREALAAGRAVEPASSDGLELDLRTAYQVQHAVIAARSQTAGRRCGYKVAMRTVPLHGEVLAGDVVREGGQISVAHMVTPKIEPELAFVLGERLAGDELLVSDVLRATAFVMPAFEVVDSRLMGGTDNPSPDLITDNAMFAAMVLGGPPVRVDALDIRGIEVSLEVGGETAATGATNRGSANPAHALIELAAHLHRFGRALEPGDVVLSGSCTAPVAVGAGDEVTARFAGLGSVTVGFVD